MHHRLIAAVLPASPAAFADSPKSTRAESHAPISVLDIIDHHQRNPDHEPKNFGLVVIATLSLSFLSNASWADHGRDFLQ